MGRPVDPINSSLNVEREARAALKRVEALAEPAAVFVNDGAVMVSRTSSGHFQRLTSGRRGACRTLVGVYQVPVTLEQIRDDLAWCVSEIARATRRST